MEFNFDKNYTPEQPSGIQTLEVTKIEATISKTGSKMIVMGYNIIGSNSKLNYDNYVLLDKAGNVVSFGFNKLKKVLEVADIEIPQGDISFEDLVSFTKATLMGRRVRAELELNDAGWSTIKGTEFFRALDMEEVGTDEDDTPAEFAASNDAPDIEMIDDVDA